jgi:hypothetical protein
MGHERVGLLPKTRKWREIVGQIAVVRDESDVADLARRTTDLLRRQLRAVQSDMGVQSAFEYLVLLGLAARRPEKAQGHLAANGIQVSENPTPLDLVKALRDFVGRSGGTSEYAEIAVRAGADAICNWFEANRTSQRALFEQPENAFDTWHGAASGTGFCELARLFFSRFTERHLNYYLEREASAAAPSLDARDALRGRLKAHVEDISKHAFETAKITQSFAAGWFNKRLGEQGVNGEEIQAFLRLAFGKIRDELLRERARV